MYMETISQSFNSSRSEGFVLKRIKAEHINRNKIVEYGKMIVMPQDEVALTARTDASAYYAKLAIWDGLDSLQFGMYQTNESSRIVDQLEQHQRTEEFLFCVAGEFIVPAALSNNDTQMPDCSHIIGLLVKQGEGILFKKGIWHCSPIPVRDTCIVMVAFKTDTHINDVVLCPLDQTEIIELID